jgi:hypothetical protein
VKHFSSAKMPAAGEETVQAVLRLFETPSDAATFLCDYNERMHVASKGCSSKQSTFHRDFLGEPCVKALLHSQPSGHGASRVSPSDVRRFVASVDVHGGILVVRSDHCPWLTAKTVSQWRVASLGEPGDRVLSHSDELKVARQMAVFMWENDLFARPVWRGQRSGSKHVTAEQQLALQLQTTASTSKFSDVSLFTPRCQHTRPVVSWDDLSTIVRQPVVVLTRPLPSSEEAVVMVADNDQHGQQTTVTWRDLKPLQQWQTVAFPGLRLDRPAKAHDRYNLSMGTCVTAVKDLQLVQRLVTLPAMHVANAAHAERVRMRAERKLQPKKRVAPPAPEVRARPKGCHNAAAIMHAKNNLLKKINNTGASLKFHERTQAVRAVQVLQHMERTRFKAKRANAAEDGDVHENDGSNDNADARAGDESTGGGADQKDDDENEDDEDDDDEEDDEDEDDDEVDDVDDAVEVGDAQAETVARRARHLQRRAELDGSHAAATASLTAAESPEGVEPGATDMASRGHKPSTGATQLVWLRNSHKQIGAWADR